MIYATGHQGHKSPHKAVSPDMYQALHKYSARHAD